MTSYQDVISFWFEEIPGSAWFKKDIEFDQLLIDRFKTTWHQAVANELSEWRQTAMGSLAEIIVLDQFSRNMFRDTPAAFAQDPQALALAQFAISKMQDQELDGSYRSFLYMPFMHSESAQIHEQAVTLFKNAGSGNLDYELKHKAIIDRFGRYPHRNKILGRTSTPEELEFLKGPGSSF